ncbi:unnamed protein product [Staurois parvus]|uniref:Uncharacterized protein n=1 Tax=Staurois parvus TaxID=386267 RepID=A0ABN9GQK1_9NEOB|nr:unnamed protein product [Staurois parvus]
MSPSSVFLGFHAGRSHHPSPSSDGSSHGNPPERCPHPLYSQDSTQEGHTIPHHHQVDGSSHGNPPERCPCPLCSQDSTQEGHTIPHHHQHEEQMYIKVEVKEEEEMRDGQQCWEEAGIKVTNKRKEASLDTSTGK